MHEVTFHECHSHNGKKGIVNIYKPQVPSSSQHARMSTINTDTGKTYHKECTGAALETVRKHTTVQDVTLFGSCFCPFVQRVWVALEVLGIPYQANEVDPYKKPQDLLAVSPKGLVPALKLNKYTPPRALNESMVILEYLEDFAAMTTGKSLLPAKGDPYARALVRLQVDHVTRTLAPAFYRFLQSAPDTPARAESQTEFHAAIDKLVELLQRGENDVVNAGGATGVGEANALKQGLGLWVGEDLGLTDVVVGPWLFRATTALKYYRDFEFTAGDKFNAYLARLIAHPAFAKTCSDDQLYIDSYERYAFNRPNTSQVANAINSGRGLP